MVDCLSKSLEGQAVGVITEGLPLDFMGHHQPNQGRKPTALAQKDKVLALKAAGVPMDKIMEQANISRASYYRLVK